MNTSINSSAIQNKLMKKRRQIIVLTIIVMIYFFSYFQRVAIPGTIFNEVQTDLKLNSAQIALLGSMFTFIYGSMQIFVGYMIDRFGALRLSLVAAVFISLGSILFPLSHNLWQLYATRILVGLGSSFIFLCIVNQIHESFSEKNFSSILSSCLLIGFVGGLMGTRPLEAVVSSYGWREPLIVVGIATSAITLIGFLFKGNAFKKKAVANNESLLVSIKTVLKNKNIYFIIYPQVVVFASYFVIQTLIGKKLFEDCFNFSSDKAANMIFLLTIVSTIFVFIAGFASRLLNNLRKPQEILCTLFSIISLVMLLLGTRYGSAWIIPALIILGISASANPIFLSSMKELSDPKYINTAMGVMNGSIYVIVGIFTAICGKILDLYKAEATATAIRYPKEAYQTILIICITLSIIAFFSCQKIKETSGSNKYDEFNIMG